MQGLSLEGLDVTPQDSSDESVVGGFDILDLGRLIPLASPVKPKKKKTVAPMQTMVGMGMMPQRGPNVAQFMQLQPHLDPTATTPLSATGYLEPPSTAPVHDTDPAPTCEFSYFAPHTLNELFDHRRIIQLSGTAPSELDQSLPKLVDHTYHTLIRLTDADRLSPAFDSYHEVYRARDAHIGKTVVLRVIRGAGVGSVDADALVGSAKQFTHPGVVKLFKAFTTTAFATNTHRSAVVLVYDYHPGSCSVLETPLFGPSRPPLNEDRVWVLLAQLLGAVQALHHHGTTMAGLPASKILVTGPNRLRISGIGVKKIVAPGSNADPEFMRADLRDVGAFAVGLIHGRVSAMEAANLDKSVAMIHESAYSDYLKTTIDLLLEKDNLQVDEVLVACAPRLTLAMQSGLAYADTLERAAVGLSSNGRLFKVACKMLFVNDRPEYDRDRRYSVTGERFPLRLLRDYIFHQVDAEEKPVVDLAHVVESLTKLDLGADEHLTLVTRNSNFCVVSSYSYLRDQVNAAFEELLSS